MSFSCLNSFSLVLQLPSCSWFNISIISLILCQEYKCRHQDHKLCHLREKPLLSHLQRPSLEMRPGGCMRLSFTHKDVSLLIHSICAQSHTFFSLRDSTLSILSHYYTGTVSIDRHPFSLWDASKSMLHCFSLCQSEIRGNMVRKMY